MSTLRIAGLATVAGGPVDLTVEAGSCTTLSGPSGSGKTLLLRSIADLDPHEGDVFCGDTESRSIPAPEWRRRVALLLSDSHWWMDRVGDHFDEVDPSGFERLGFDADVLQWSVSRLSTGEKQRLGLLRVLTLRPDVLLLDELTANLDQENTERAERLVADYRSESKAAVLWVTHDPTQSTRVGTAHRRIDAGVLLGEEGA